MGGPRGVNRALFTSGLIYKRSSYIPKDSYFTELPGPGGGRKDVRGGQEWFALDIVRLFTVG